MDPNINDKVKNILSTEVKFILAIGTFVFGVITPFYGMKQDIALMKNDISNINSNHEVHIQDIFSEIKEIKISQSVQNDKMIQLQEQIIRISK